MLRIHRLPYYLHPLLFLLATLFFLLAITITSAITVTITGTVTITITSTITSTSTGTSSRLRFEFLPNPIGRGGRSVEVRVYCETQLLASAFFGVASIVAVVVVGVVGGRVGVGMEVVVMLGKGWDTCRAVWWYVRRVVEAGLREGAR